MKRAFLIHGYGGYPQEGWRPWLAKELPRDFTVIIPQMPDTDRPTMDKWLAYLAKIVGQVSPNDYFVGHSLGGITVLRFLEALKDKERIGGCVLVAAFAKPPVYEGDMTSFFQAPIDWAKIRSHCSKFVAIHSDNDPFVPLGYADDFKNNLGAKIIVEHNMNHFSGDDNPPCLKLPSVLSAILAISK